MKKALYIFLENWYHNSMIFPGRQVHGMLDITLLGTGGVMPLPDRALTAAYIRHEAAALLIDCGEGTQTALRHWGLRFKTIDAILLTHYHADHVSGLPGLLLTMGNEGRRDSVTLYGPPGLKKIVSALTVFLTDLPFPLVLRELEGGAPVQFSQCGLDITALPLKHSVPCLGYRMDLPRAGKFDPRAAQERGVPVRLWSRLQKGERIDGFSPEDVLGPPRRGLRVLYATDTRPVPELTRYGESADLLILEGMFGDPDKQGRALESCHMTMAEAAAIAASARAERLWLTHFSPATPHPEEYREAIEALFPGTVIAPEGLRQVLRFAEA